MARIVSFGEILLRFTPQANRSISEAAAFECFYGGSEANVTIGLSVLGNSTSYITVLPDNELGTAAARNLNKYGVSTDNIIFQGDVLGTYYLQSGLAEISSSVIYNRCNSEVAKADGAVEKFNYNDIFKNCDLFHISGISFAISDKCRELCFRLLEEAGKRNIPVSFDFNYRGKLWSIEEAAKVYQDIIPYVDIVFCSDKDLKCFLNGISAEDILNNNKCRYVVARNREPLTLSHHTVTAQIISKTSSGIKSSEAVTYEFAVYDRVGSGDAFAACILHSLLIDKDNIDEALDFGIGGFIMKHSVSGDYLAVSEKEIRRFFEDFKKNGSKDVRR